MEIEQSGRIIAHCCRNHGMRPIISRYFIPIKKVEMIEMHFGTQHSLWEPPRIQDGRQNSILDTFFELLLFVYNATTYDISLSSWFDKRNAWAMKVLLHFIFKFGLPAPPFTVTL